MKRTEYLLRKNSGSSLVMVLISIAFLSILASMLLSATAANLQMKAVEKKSKANFYKAETAIDEIKAGLAEVTAGELEKAYKKVMEHYLTHTEEERDKIFAAAYIDGLAEKLGYTHASSSAAYDTTMLAGYIKEPGAVLKIPSGDNQLIKDTADVTKPKFLTLKNVTVSYTDSNHFNTTIRTDFVINIPDVDLATPGGSGSGGGIYPSYADYGLIADKKIAMDGAVNVSLIGDAYAGTDGIQMDTASVWDINASHVITRGDISVKNRSNLTIKGNTNVWAQNISTLKGNDTEEMTSISITGKCYVANDLKLNAKVSNIKLEGEYFGYNSINTLESNKSSAIIINGIRSNLDMSGLTKLLIAGRAFIDPQSRGNTAVGNDMIPTGESLAVKGNQLAYLVPPEYIWCGTNPVSQADYNSMPPGMTEVNLSKVVSGTKIKLTDYAHNYTKVFYNAGGQKVVYYYLKFDSQNKANLYMQKYFKEYNGNEAVVGIVDNRIKSYAAAIKLNTPLLTCMTKGNIFTFGDSKSKLIENTADPDAVSDAMQSLSAEFQGKYTAFVQTLKDSITEVPSNPSSLFQSLINTSTIVNDNLAGMGFIGNVKKVMVAGKTVYIVDNKADGTVFHIPIDGREGIVVANGDVSVSGNYKGLILSGGVITLEPSASITASSGTVIDILSSGNAEVNKYFKNYEHILPPPAESTVISDKGKVNISSLITYDNWTKNED